MDALETAILQDSATLTRNINGAVLTLGLSPDVGPFPYKSTDDPLSPATLTYEDGTTVTLVLVSAEVETELIDGTVRSFYVPDVESGDDAWWAASSLITKRQWQALVYFSELASCFWVEDPRFDGIFGDVDIDEIGVAEVAKKLKEKALST